MRLDRSRPFGVSWGDSRVKYVQDGTEFDKDGNSVVEDQKEPVVVVAQQAPAAPAPVEVPQAAPVVEASPAPAEPLPVSEVIGQRPERFQLRRKQ